MEIKYLGNKAIGVIDDYSTFLPVEHECVKEYIAGGDIAGTINDDGTWSIPDRETTLSEWKTASKSILNNNWNKYVSTGITTPGGWNLIPTLDVLNTLKIQVSELQAGLRTELNTYDSDDRPRAIAAADAGTYAAAIQTNYAEALEKYDLAIVAILDATEINTEIDLTI